MVTKFTLGFFEKMVAAEFPPAASKRAKLCPACQTLKPRQAFKADPADPLGPPICTRCRKDKAQAKRSKQRAASRRYRARHNGRLMTMAEIVEARAKIDPTDHT